MQEESRKKPAKHAVSAVYSSGSFYLSQTEGGSRVQTSSALHLSALRVQLEEDVRLKMGGGLSIDQTVTINRNEHRFTVDNGNTSHRVTLGNNINAEWTGAVALANENGTLPLSSEGGNTMSSGTLAAGNILVESAEGTRMTLSDMTLAASGADISLTNIDVRGNSSFTTSASQALTLNADKVTFVLDGSNSSAGGAQPAMLLAADPLTQTEVASNVFYINSGMLEGVNVAGNMTLDLSYRADEIKAGGYENTTLSFAESMDFGTGTQVMVTLNSVTAGPADYAAENMARFSISKLPTETIPEPGSTAHSPCWLSPHSWRADAEGNRGYRHSDKEKSLFLKKKLDFALTLTYNSRTPPGVHRKSRDGAAR